MLAGVILAAGLSTRMTKFKPFLPIGDTTFIKRLILQMRSVGVENIVVVTGYRHEEVVEHLKDDEIIIVFNENFYNSEMLESVKLGISEISDNASKILLSPVDVVMSPLWIFNHIIQIEGDFIRPIYGGEPGHPVLISKSLFDHILSYTGDRGLRGAVESSNFNIVDVEVDEPNILLDADTPEDYRKVLAQFNESIGASGKLSLEIDLNIVADDLVYSKRFMQLLSLIDSTKSLSKSAEAIKLSYTKVWQMLKEAEEKLSLPLVDRKVGGRAGGGSKLTIEGKTFLNRYRQMENEIYKNSQEIFNKYFSDLRV